MKVFESYEQLLLDAAERLKEAITMAEYGKCSKCKYCDPTECSGYKWYCEWYRTYEDPDVIRECEHFRER